jgi:hypothetical protein
MKLLAIKASALALATLGAANAQTVTTNPSNIEVSFYTEGNNFVVVPPGGSGPIAQTQTSGLNILNVPGYGEVYDFCSQYFVGRNETVDYNVTSGLGSLTATQKANVSALLSNALPEFNSMLATYISHVGAGEWDADPVQRAHLNAYAAGIQMAIWELVSDTTPELDNSKPGKGIFATDLNAGASDTVKEGEYDGVSFVNNVKNGVWVDKGGMIYYYADSDTQQDRIWAQVVPEPSAALLGVLSFGFLLRRRRN